MIGVSDTSSNHQRVELEQDLLKPEVSNQGIF